MPLNILVAEDNPGDVMLIRRALEQHHIPHQLHVVTDGAQAVELVSDLGKPGQEAAPDVLLLDLNLPKIDGPAVLKEFRRNPKCAETPVVVMSSSDAPRDHGRVEGFRISRYFRKPSDLAKFMELGALVWEVAGHAY